MRELLIPYYDYLCRSCNHQFEEFRSIESRLNLVCPECFGSVKMILLRSPVQRSFTPYFDKSLGTHVSSTKDLQVKLKIMGLEETTGSEEVKGEIRRRRLQKEKEAKEKGPPEAFYRAYYKAEQDHPDLTDAT